MILKAVGCALVFGLGAFAQPDAPGVMVNLDGFRYPTFAALIQGDVLFETSLSGRRLVTGLPILAKLADANLETWTLPPLDAGRYLVWYHFSLIGEPRQLIFPIRSKLDRFFLAGRVAPHCEIYSLNRSAKRPAGHSCARRYPETATTS